MLFLSISGKIFTSKQSFFTAVDYAAVLVLVMSQWHLHIAFDGRIVLVEFFHDSGG